MQITNIIESKEVAQYLKKRGLLKQYKKAKTYLLLGNFQQIDFKKRKPKKDQIWYFRINQQFRALCYFTNDKLVVFEVDNHQ